LKIRADKETDDAQMTVILEYNGRDREYAKKLVDELSQDCVRIGGSLIENRKAVIAAQRQEAARAVADARDRLKGANTAIETLVAEQLVELQRQQDAPRPVPTPHIGEPDGDSPRRPAYHDERPSWEAPQQRDSGADRWSESPAPQDSSTNSDWSKLTQDLELLKSQIRRLMDGAIQPHTHANSAEHPTTAGRSRESNSDYRNGYSDPIGSTTSDAFDPHAAGSANVPDESGGGAEPRMKSRDELLAEIHRLPQYAIAESKYSAAEASHQKALEMQERVLASDWSETAAIPRVVQDARITRRWGGSPGIGSVLPLGWISVTIGCCFAVLCRLASTSRTFRSVDDVAVALDVSIVGAITTSDGPKFSAAESDGRALVRYATLAGEATLAAIVVLMAFVAATDHLFAKRLLRDPFSAYADAIDRVTSWLM
jgi:hypothetical protein